MKTIRKRKTHRGQRSSRRSKRRLWRYVKLFIFAASLAAGFWAANRHIPSQHLFWRSLNPNAPLGLSTSTQLLRVSLSPNSTCDNLARQADGLQSVPAPPKDGPEICGWRTARYVAARDQIRLAPGEATMQCPLALGSHIWAGEIDRAAQKIFGESVTHIHHVGTYSCRRQRGNSSGAWSEHAFANAWDITGFTLSNGEVISVLNDWNGEADKKTFLRSVRKSACRIFRVTLSPDYNDAHKDHFHLDMGPQKSCR